jgi:hypothetical protein
MDTGESPQILLPVRAQVVQNEVDTFLARVASAKASPGLQEIPGCLALVNHAFQDVPVYVVEAEELLRSCCFVIRRPYSLRVSLPGPGHTP